ncbi:MAG: phage tail protein [Candidatus Electrothrix scaldis]|nr:MAG: phage tail protein [Candidatus Electrothrix sp. GW3-3]
MPQQDIFRNYAFILELQGERAGYFTRVSGLGMKVSCLEYREGGMPNVVRKLPVQTTVAPILCEWGLTATRSMWDWFMTAVNGNVERKEISIIILGTDGVTEKTRWNLSGVWPSEWRGAELDAGGNNIAIERMTLQAESVERDPGV